MVRANDGTEASLSDVHGVLASGRRRIALRTLDESGGEATVDELVEAVLAGEEGSRTAAAGRRVGRSLSHTHLPKLRRFGFVEYDADDGTVSLTPAGRRAERVRLATADQFRNA